MQDIFTVVTYNVYVGFTNEAEDDLPAGEERKKRVSKWLKEEQPDIVAFQELNGYTYQKLEQESRAWNHSHASVLYGTSDFRVGISSKHPIKIKECIFQGMWHGLLHVSTGGVDVIVTHFSPFEYKLCRLETEMVLHQVEKAQLQGWEVLVMGDLNSLSPDDAEAITKTDIVEKYARRYREKDHIQNLIDGQPDYQTIRKLKERGLTDLQAQQRSSLPELPRPRLDYIWASEGLAAKCRQAHWHIGEAFTLMSDHFPVNAVFQTS